MTLRCDGEPFDLSWGRAALSMPPMLPGLFATKALVRTITLVQETSMSEEAPAGDLGLP